MIRVDLAFTIRSGHRPAFFQTDISWDPYLAQNKAKRMPSHENTANEAVKFIGLLDVKLYNVWIDLKKFSDLCNLASQTGSKLPSAHFSEIMVSILYRLLHQSCETDVAHESLRVGMVAYAGAIFFRWTYLARGQKNHAAQGLDEALVRLWDCRYYVPDQIVLWLLMVWYTSVLSPAGDEKYDPWLKEQLDALQLSSWVKARKVLKSIMWIDAFHDSKAQLAIDRALGHAGAGSSLSPQSSSGASTGFSAWSPAPSAVLFTHTSVN